MKNKFKCSDCPKLLTSHSARMSIYDKRFLCWRCFTHENKKRLSELTFVPESKDSAVDLSFHDKADVGDRLLFSKKIKK